MSRSHAQASKDEIIAAYPLESPGWFEASQDPAVMQKRLLMVQKFLQSAVTAAHTAANPGAALAVLNGVLEKGSPASQSTAPATDAADTL